VGGGKCAGGLVRAGSVLRGGFAGKVGGVVFVPLKQRCESRVVVGLVLQLL
jgi:hypothetical protein